MNPKTADLSPTILELELQIRTQMTLRRWGGWSDFTPQQLIDTKLDIRARTRSLIAALRILRAAAEPVTVWCEWCGGPPGPGSAICCHGSNLHDAPCSFVAGATPAQIAAQGGSDA